MIEIQRHEQNGILQGFTFYAPQEITLLVHSEGVYYSITRYRGHCDVGAPNALSSAVAFPNNDAALQFISDNNLQPYAQPIMDWHEDALFQIYMTQEQAITLSEDVPELTMYRKAQGIQSYREPNGVYFYVNFWEPGHREIMEQYATITEKEVE